MDESVVDSTNAADCEDKRTLTLNYGKDADADANLNRQIFRLLPACWNDQQTGYSVWPTAGTSDGDKVMIGLDHDFLTGQIPQSIPGFIQITNINTSELIDLDKNIYQNSLSGLQNSSGQYTQGFVCQSSANVDMVIADQSNSYAESYYQNCLKIDTMSPTQIGNQIVSASVPSCVPYRGQYGFEISFDKHCKENKSITWTYSEELEKLYVRMGSTCPLKFRCLSGHPPANCVIRATPVYIRPEHVQEVVTRCPNHSSSEQIDSHPAPSHLMRCEHKMARYVTDRITNRQSVVVPLEYPQAGAQWVTNLYQFMCFSSCVGGLNRRPVRVIFTLESGATIIGRQSFEVRICACPVRDRRVEEGATVPGHKSKPATVIPKIETTKRDINQTNPEETMNEKLTTNKPKKKCHPSEYQQQNQLPQQIQRNQLPQQLQQPQQPNLSQPDDDNSIFTLHVQGRENFELLFKVNEALQLSSSIKNFKT